MILAPKPGQPPVKIEKRVDDTLVVEIDCSTLLTDTKHMFFGIPSYSIATSSDEISISSNRVLRGKILTFTISKGQSLNVPFKDYLVQFSLSNSNGSKLTVPVSVRCYSV